MKLLCLQCRQPLTSNNWTEGRKRKKWKRCKKCVSLYHKQLQLRQLKRKVLELVKDLEKAAKTLEVVN